MNKQRIDITKGLELLVYSGDEQILKSEPIVCSNNWEWIERLHLDLILSFDRQWSKEIPYCLRMQCFKALCFKEQTAFKIKSLKYNDFLKTLYWRTLSQQVRYENRYECQLCCNKAVFVHHRNYKRHGYEAFHYKEDLTLLCQGCHEKFHDKSVE